MPSNEKIDVLETIINYLENESTVISQQPLQLGSVGV